MSGDGKSKSVQQAVDEISMENTEEDDSRNIQVESRDRIGEAQMSNSFPLTNQERHEDTETADLGMGNNSNNDTVISDDSNVAMHHPDFDSIRIHNNLVADNNVVLNEDRQVTSRHERYRHLMGHNRLWRMRSRRTRHVETQSLASRSLHYNANTDTYSAAPARSIVPKESIHITEQSPTLMDFCRKKDWKNARLRAISHPHEAEPSYQKNINRFCQQSFSVDPNHNSANNVDISNNNNATSSNFRYDPMLSYADITASAHSTALSLACRGNAPLETIKTIVKASPRQLRFTRSNSICNGTPLHEAIGLGGSKSDWKVIKYLIQADEEFNAHVRLELEEWKSMNIPNIQGPNSAKIQDFNNNATSIGAGVNNSQKSSSQTENPNIFSMEKKVGPTFSVQEDQERLGTPFNFVQEQTCPYSSQKSTKRRDSVGRTALHRWIDRVLGIYRVTSALALLNVDSEYDMDSDLVESDNADTVILTNNDNDESIMNVGTDQSQDLFNNDEEIKTMKEDSEEIFEITKLLVKAYPQASASGDRSGKTPLAIALQWEPWLLIRYQLQQRQRLERNQREASERNSIVEATNRMCRDDIDHNAHIQKLIKEIEYRILGIVKVMAKAYPPAIKVKCSSFGCTPLHHAILHKRNLETIRILLETSPESTLIASNIGELPLHTAASMAAPFRLLKLILNAGPRAASKEDRGGRTALHWIWIRYIIAASSLSTTSTSTSTSASTRQNDGTSQINTVSYNAWNNNPDAQMNMFPQNIGPVSAQHRRTVPLEWNAMQEAWFSKLKNHLHDGVFRQKMMNSPFWKAVEFFLFAFSYPNQPRFSMDSKSNFMVVHAATAASCPRALLRLALILYPDSVIERDDKFRLPIHIAATRPMNTLWKLDETEPSVMELLLKASPETAEIADSEFRLPIHLAIDFEKKDSSLKRRKGRNVLGQPIHGNVQALMHFSPQCLSTKDGKYYGMLCPFMLAGCGNESNLNLCYELLRQAPEAVQNVLQHSNCSDVRPTSYFDPVQKRQRLPRKE